MNIKKILYILTAGIIFAGCSNLIDDSSMNQAQNISSTVTDGTEKGVSLKLNIAESSARSALPEVTKKDLIYLTLRYAEKYNSDSSVITEEVSVGDWSSVADMTAATLAFKKGTFTFRFYAMSKGGAVFGDQQTVTIKDGVNNLIFSPTLETLLTDYSGEGSLSIEMRYNTKNVVKVTAGLYGTNGEKVPGFNDEELTVTNAGFVKYEKTDIPSGNYIAIFKFWADEEKTQLLGTYREYASIVDGLTSSSECVVNELGSLFNIYYECNGGAFTENYTAPGSYTRQGDNLTLPGSNNIKNENYNFGGWFTSPDFSGSELTFIPTGTVGHLVLYARWIPKIKIMYSPNGGSIKTTTQVVTADEGSSDSTITLKTPAELGLTPPKKGKIFLGWARSATTVIPSDAQFKESYNLTTPADSSDTDTRDEYIIYKKEGGTITEGAVIKTNDSLVLYAIWSYSQINPVKDNANAESSLLDFDGDGLTDWEEVYRYHTDPMSSDTDGDGWTDKQELSMYNAESKYFSPLIADTPFLDVVFDQKPVIGYVYQISENQTVTKIQSTTEGKIGSHSDTATNTKTFNMTHSWKAEINGHIASKGPVLEKQMGGAAGVSGSYSSGDTYTYSQTDSQNWSQTWQNGKNIADSNGKTISGGKIRLPVKLKNQTQVGYTIKSITIAVNRLAYGKVTEKVPVGSYTSTAPMTLHPNSSSGQINIELNLSVAETEQLLKYSNTIFVEISGFQITTFKDSQSGNNDFTEALTEVRAKTAAIYIDCGPGSSRKPRTYNIAVKNKLNPDGTSMNDQYQPVTLKEIFDQILELKENYNGSTAGYELYETTGSAKGKGLKSLYGITNSNTQKHGNWYIEHKTIKNGLQDKTIYSHFFDGKVNGSVPEKAWDFQDIEIHAGDEVNFYFSVDRDEDNLPLVKELVYGTSDNNKDTDGDYLSDYDEVFGWWQEGLKKEAYMAAYGEYNKDNKEFWVYSNPTLKDTDGDGMDDYTYFDYPYGHIADEDPINPKIKNDKSLKPLAYYQTSLTGAKYNLKLPTEGGTETSPVSQTNTIIVKEDTIFFDISPAHPYSKLEYETKITKNGVTDIAWNELTSKTPFKLNVGNNSIKLRCQNKSYIPKDDNDDNEKYSYWTINVSSRLKDFTGFSVATYPDSNGEVILTWNSYSDLRCEDPEGGYVLYGVQNEASEYDDSVDRAKLISAVDKIQDLDKKDRFYLKLSKDDLKTNVGIKLQLAPDKSYQFDLYGYAHKNSLDTYYQECIGHTSVKTAKSNKAILCFYAHYVEDVNDCDGSSDPNYYWNFTCTNPDLKFSGCDLSRSNTVDFDVDDEGEAKYATFGGNSIRYYDYKSKPGKFGETTKKIMCEFDRKAGSNNNFTVRWTVNEKDNGYDDTLGTVEAKFSYDSASDTWTCNWTEGDGAKEVSKQLAQDSVTISAGKKTNYDTEYVNNGPFRLPVRWYVYNSSYGSVLLHWDWSWDVETKEELQKNQGK